MKIFDMKEFESKLIMNELIGRENNWYAISYQYELPEDFIDKYANKLNWNVICRHQELSEKIMDKYHDKLDWNEVSRYQKMYLDFLMKYADKVNISYLYYNENISCKYTDIMFWYKGEGF